MQLNINGSNENLDCSSIIDVINHYGLQEKMIVIEADGDIVPREKWESHPLREGMRLEIVHFVGGG